MPSKTTHPTQRPDFNQWAKYIHEETQRMAYGALVKKARPAFKGFVSRFGGWPEGYAKPTKK